jgi:hypothetical protein
LRRPAVLVHQEPGRAAGLEHGEIELAVAVEVGDGHAADRPVLLHAVLLTGSDDSSIGGQPGPDILRNG